MNTPSSNSNALPGQPALPSGTFFHLIPEPGEASPSRLDPLEIPAGVSGLRVAPGGLPELVATEAAGAEAWLEPLVREGRFRLLFLNRPVTPILLNDQLAPPSFLSREGDQIRLGDGISLEVGVFARPSVGAPPAGLIGKPCPVCRVPLTAETRIYQCPICEGALHLEEGDEETALQCAQVSGSCPSCQHPVRLEHGYLSSPVYLEEEL